MADEYIGSGDWREDVYILKNGDAASGAEANNIGGLANTPHRELADRSVYLKNRLDKRSADGHQDAQYEAFPIENTGRVNTTSGDIELINESYDNAKTDMRVAVEKHITEEMEIFVNATKENGGRFPSQYLKFFDALVIDIENYKTI